MEETEADLHLLLPFFRKNTFGKTLTLKEIDRGLILADKCVSF